MDYNKHLDIFGNYEISYEQEQKLKKHKMDNNKHFQLIKRGVTAWNEWKSKNDEIINLDEVDLSKVDLGGANLSKTNLKFADLSGANLREANLSKTDLTGLISKELN